MSATNDNNAPQAPHHYHINASFPAVLSEAIFSFLWFNEVSSVAQTSKSLNQVVTSERFGRTMLAHIDSYLYRNPRNMEEPLRSRTMTNSAQQASPLLLARRLSSWPTGIDNNSLLQLPRNVSILKRPENLCALYGGRRKESHKGYTVVAADDHYPCLPGAFTQPRHKHGGGDEMQAWERLPRVELQKAKKEGVIARSMAPFTRLLCTPGTDAHSHLRFKVASLSCVAYYEANVHQNQGYSAHDGLRRFSIGLACALFPLRKKQLGFDNYSFGYHRDGHFVHGNRRCGHLAAYSPGDTVGCGLIYPPLCSSGKIFFTKNGELVGTFEMGVEGLLALPWFPALGLAPSIPMEFNFGTARPFEFDVVAFEARLLSDAFPNSPSFYTTLAREQEARLWVPRHPVFYDAFFSSKKDISIRGSLTRRRLIAGDEDRYGRSRSASFTNCSAVASHGSANGSANGSACGSTNGSASGSVYGDNGGALSSNHFSSNLDSGGLALRIDPLPSNNSLTSLTNSNAAASPEDAASAFQQKSNSPPINASPTQKHPLPLPLPQPPSLAASGKNNNNNHSNNNAIAAGIRQQHRRHGLGRGGNVTSSYSFLEQQTKANKGKDISPSLDADEDEQGNYSQKSQNLLKNKCVPSRCSSLYLDQALRAATLMGITDTRRVMFGGSDASWEGTGESESEEEEEQDDGNAGGSRMATDLVQDISNRSMRPPQSTWTNPRAVDSNRSIAALQDAALASLARESARDSAAVEEDQYSMAVELSSDELDSVDGSNQGATTGAGSHSSSTTNNNSKNMSLTEYLEQAELERKAEWMQARANNANASDDDGDDRSIATSLFVEVASVDEGGSYIGYGAASASDSEEGDDENEDEEEDYEEDERSRRRRRGFSRSRASSSNGDINISSRGGSGAPSTPWGSGGSCGSSIDSGGHFGYSNREHGADDQRHAVQFLSSMMSSTRGKKMRENNYNDLDGYDGASERGHGTAMEDNDNDDVGEEI